MSAVTATVTTGAVSCSVIVERCLEQQHTSAQYTVTYSGLRHGLQCLCLLGVLRSAGMSISFRRA